MAASLAEILKDPNYQNANAATKQAIFDRYAPQDPNYANANSATQAAIRTKFGLQTQEKSAPTASWANVISSAPYKALASTADVLYGTPQNIYNLLAAGYGTAATALGRPDLAPEVEAPPTPVANFLTRHGFIRDTSNMTPEQRMADVALQSATGAYFNPAASGKAAISNFLAGGAAGGAGQAVTEATGSPGAGLAVSMLAPAATGYAVRKPAAALRDVFNPEQRAARLVQATAKGAFENQTANLTDVKAAIIKHPNKTVSEALMLEGVNNPAMQALAQIAETDARWTQAVKAATSQEELDAITQLAGGATQTGAALARQAEKTALTERTAPQRERAFEGATIGGTLGRRLEQESAQAGAAASQAAEDVRRFGRVAGDQYAGMRTEPRVEVPEILGQPAAEQAGVQQRANEWARNWRASGTGEGPTGLPRPPTAATYPGELAQRAEEVATRRAGESLAAGEARQEAELRLATLKAAGIKPLRPDSVLEGIRSRLRDDSIAGNEKAQQVLKGVSNMLTDWVNKHGDISVEALYSIRKHGINSIVEQLMGASTQQAKNRFAAGMVEQLNPLIDAAIEQAGGRGWKKYLDDYAEGMRGIEQQEMAGIAQRLYKENPSEFVALVRGERPDMVEDVFGPNRFDITKQMGDKLAPLQKIADRIERTKGAAEASKKGADELRLIGQDVSSRLHIPNVMSAKVAVANEALRLLQGRIDPATTRILANGFKQGKSLEALLNLVPFKDRVTVMDAFKNSAILRPGATIATTNALFGGQNNNALAER